MKLKILDYIAILFSLFIFVSFFIYGNGATKESGTLLVQDQLGKAIYPLSNDRTIIAKGPVGISVIVIKDGNARFEQSDCKNNLCVLMGSISKSGEWAACLPNKVFISIEGKTDEQKADSLSY